MRTRSDLRACGPTAPSPWDGVTGGCAARAGSAARRSPRAVTPPLQRHDNAITPPRGSEAPNGRGGGRQEDPPGCGARAAQQRFCRGSRDQSARDSSGDVNRSHFHCSNRL